MALPAHLELTPAWRAISADLRRRVGDTDFELHLASLRADNWDGSVLRVIAPAPKRAWISKRFGIALERSVRAVIGDAARVSVTPGKPGGAPAAAARADAVQPAAQDPSLPLNRRHTFDQFIIGNGNRLAHGAALAVAENPGTSFNPLFLHAPPGLGKTHLLHAIGNFVTTFSDSTTVRYTTVESFTNHFLSSLSTKTTDIFKRMYRDADVLLIDDVQFLASKAKTEEEFFHTFNALYDSGRQLVLTCDRLPSQLVGIEQRLRDRFESGLVATIEPPDLPMRIAILRKRAMLDRLIVTDTSVFELIATRITDNVRALEGALIRIIAHQSLLNRPLDADLATAVLDAIAPAPSSPELSVEHIQQTVADYFDITLEEMLSTARPERIAWPRQVAIQLARDLTDLSLNDLGRAFGGRNHATIMHSCKRVSSRVLDSPDAAHDVDNLRTRLRQG